MDKRVSELKVGKTIGNFIKQLREDKGLTLEELSLKTNWSPKVIHQYEITGDIGLSELDKLAKLYGMTRKEILIALDKFLDQNIEKRC